MKHLIGLVVLLCGMWLQAGVARAVDATYERLQSVGLQPVLVYQMSKSVCLVMMGAQAQHNAETAFVVSQQIDAALRELRQDRATLGDGTELATELSHLAAGMTASARQIVSGDFHAVPMQILLDRHGAVTAQARQIWGELGEEWSTEPSYQTYLTTLAGVYELDALAQEVLLDLCFVRMDIKRAAKLASLPDKIARFELLAQALKLGDDSLGFSKAPNINAKFGYDKVTAKWKTLRSILDQALEGQALEVDDIQLASVMSDAIHKQVTDILGRYVPP